jgi:metal-responsive CopG/Arc/MetJ family transcriptional regulator
VITSLPGLVCTAIDEVAAAGGASRMLAISDLAALALGRRDLALRLSLPDEMAPVDLVGVAGRRLIDCRGWQSVTTQLPADLLPELDALVATTGVNRSRIVGNLVTHMVSQKRPELANLDIAWPDQQGRLPLAI